METTAIPTSSRLYKNIRREAGPRKDVMKAAIENPGLVMGERRRRSYSLFMKTFWEEVSGDALQWNWHIGYLCGILMRMAHRVAQKQPKEYDLIINVPPGSTKSITCRIMFPIWCWTNWPWMRFICGSYSAALSLEHAEYARDIIRSEKFKWMYPHLDIKRDKDSKSNFRLVERNYSEKGSPLNSTPRGSMYSTSVGATVTGFHGHILIVDDPIDPEGAVSEARLTEANRWMDETLTTRAIDKAVTPTILIMQRLNQDDPTGHVLARDGGKILHICLPGEIENYADKVNPPGLKEKYVDGLLDPVRMGWEVLDDLKAKLGQYGYAGQIGQSPTPPGGGMFKVDHFQYLSTMPSAPNIKQTVRYWDKASSTGKRSSYTVGAKMHRLANGKFIISDVKRGKWTTDERERIIRETAEVDGKSCLIYHEQEPGSGGKDSAYGTTLNLAGYISQSDRPTGDKAYRADPYSVQVNNGSVMLLVGDWNKEFVEEHRYFPHSTNTDQVDAASGAFTKIMKRTQARLIGRSRRDSRRRAYRGRI